MIITPFLILAGIFLMFLLIKQLERWYIRLERGRSNPLDNAIPLLCGNVNGKFNYKVVDELKKSSKLTKGGVEYNFSFDPDVQFIGCVLGNSLTPKNFCEGDIVIGKLVNELNRIETIKNLKEGQILAIKITEETKHVSEIKLREFRQYTMQSGEVLTYTYKGGTKQESRPHSIENIYGIAEKLIHVN